MITRIKIQYMCGVANVWTTQDVSTDEMAIRVFESLANACFGIRKSMDDRNKVLEREENITHFPGCFVEDSDVTDILSFGDWVLGDINVWHGEEKYMDAHDFNDSEEDREPFFPE